MGTGNRFYAAFVLSALVHGMAVLFILWRFSGGGVSGPGGGVVLQVTLSPAIPAPEQAGPESPVEAGKAEAPRKAPEAAASSADIEGSDPKRYIRSYLESDAYQAYLEREAPEGGAGRSGPRFESDIVLQKKYNLYRPPAGISEQFDGMTGKGIARIVLGNGLEVCFDISEPGPLERDDAGLWEFTACR